jgi:molybdate transport system substrate-binding protein
MRAVGCAVLLCVALLAVGCKRSRPAPHDALVVFAAASLREPFTGLREEFRRSHPQAVVTFNFAGSQELRAQIEHGAAADVFASADLRHMDALVRGQHATAARSFARNEGVLVVAAKGPEALQRFADLPRAERLVVGADTVPIGRYTQQVLERAGKQLGPDWRARVESKVVSRELNVRQVLAKVSLGEADAGIVYRSDVHAEQGSVRVVAIPAELNVTAEYPIAVLTDAAHPELARAFTELVLSPVGQRALTRGGFLSISTSPPP